MLHGGRERPARQPGMASPQDDLQGNDDEKKATHKGIGGGIGKTLGRPSTTIKQRKAAVAERGDDLAERDAHAGSIGGDLVQDIGGVAGKVHARAGFRRISMTDERRGPRRRADF